MSISLVPSRFNREHQTLLSYVPKNLQYMNYAVDVVVPFDYYGVEFILTVSDPGTPVTITVNRPSTDNLPNRNIPNVITVIPKEEVTTVVISLPSGINILEAVSDSGSMLLRVGIANWASWLYTFGQQLNNTVITRLNMRQEAVLSRTGSMLVERWYSNRDLLPRSNAMHRLGMRMVIDSFNNASRSRSVERIGAAITGNNPVIYRTNNNDVLHPALGPMYSLMQEFSGNEFHVWVLDVCTMAFITAGRYIENFPNIWEGVVWQENSIGYVSVDNREPHVLINAEGSDGCSIEDIVLNEGCFDRIRPWVRITKNKAFKICLASYLLDTSVEVCKALGAVYWDCDTLTLEELITDPETVTPEDPTGDGWVGHALDGRFDYPYGGSFDTFGAVSDFLEDQCPYERGPVVTPLMITRTDIQIDLNIDVSGTLNVVGLAHGPIYQPV